jgi:hypothetical protein
LAHSHDVYVSTDGFMKRLLTHPEVFTVINCYLHKCKDVGFDVTELSLAFSPFRLERRGLAAPRGQGPLLWSQSES